MRVWLCASAWATVHICGYICVSVCTVGAQWLNSLGFVFLARLSGVWQWTKCQCVRVEREPAPCVIACPRSDTLEPITEAVASCRHGVGEASVYSHKSQEERGKSQQGCEDGRGSVWAWPVGCDLCLGITRPTDRADREAESHRPLLEIGGVGGG